MQEPTLIIFDCDGVLIDSELLAARALIETLAEYGVNLTLAEALERFVGTNTIAEIADIEKTNGIKLPPEYAEKKRTRNRQLAKTSLQAITGVRDLVSRLQVDKCVASNSSLEYLNRCLGYVDLWDCFAPHIFSAAQVNQGKPAPDLFLFAARQMNATPRDCLVIEDSAVGVRAAKAAGMRVYGFTGGGHCHASSGAHLLKEGAEKIFATMDDLALALFPKGEIRYGS
jgi:HAD superfamily hydrolase (TIGR01509 family)